MVVFLWFANKVVCSYPGFALVGLFGSYPVVMLYNDFSLALLI